MCRVVRSIALLLAVSLAAGFTRTVLNIPSADGPLIVDGNLQEELWKQAVPLPLAPVAFGKPFPEGGEVRVVVRNGYLCLSARLPEPGRVVARSTGRNPVWWNEDLIIWTFRYHSAEGRNTLLTLSVNPLGGYRVEPAGVGDGQAVVAAADLDREGWSVEAAIAVSHLASIGFVGVERVRASRPNAPELRWYWPGVNDRLPFQLPSSGISISVPKVVLKDWSTREGTQPVRVTATTSHALTVVPHRVWTDPERRKLAVEEMWRNNLKARVADVAAAERKDWEKVRTVADWETFRERRLAALKESLGPFPPRTPLRAEVTRRLDYGDGFVIENVLFESRPGLVVTANLYLPAKIEGRIPAIVVVHSHHAPKVQSELQDLGMTWSRNGTGVLVMDQLGAGERLQSQPWPRESYYSRYAMGMQLYLPGESLMKWMVWDLMRGIDFLLERPYIDPNRLVMLGAVAGGGDPAAVTAALDSRIAAVIPFNFGEAGPEEHYTEGPRWYDFETAWPGWGEWESTRNLYKSISGQFFPWFVCASVAPRRFIYAFEISWPKGVEQQPPWPRYQKVFSLYGKRENLDQVDGFGPFPGPGECTNVGVYLRSKIYPILKRWLDINIPSKEYHNVRPDQDLMCLTPRAAAERKPKTVSELAFILAQEKLSDARSKLNSLPPAERLASLRASLQKRLGDIEPNPSAPVNSLWKKDVSEFVVEAVSLETAPGLSVPVMLFKRRGETNRRLPVVLALAQEGKEGFLTNRNPELTTLLGNGIAVCLVDVRGTGEMVRSQVRGPSAMSLAATELMLGQTALGARLKDTRTVLRYLLRREDLDAERIVLWGDSFVEPNSQPYVLDQSLNQEPGPQQIRQAEPLGSLLALLAALYEDRVMAVATRRGLASYLSALKDPFCYVPLDVIVPSIVESGDIPDIVAALSPRPVLLQGFVDGRNRPLPQAAFEKELAGAVAAYHRAPSVLTLRDDPDPTYLAKWIVSHLSPGPR